MFDHSYQEKMVILRLRAQILKDSLLPEALHQVPILDDTMTDGVVYAICL